MKRKGGTQKEDRELAARFSKLNDVEHVLKRPDTYLGSLDPCTETRWLYDAALGNMVQQSVETSPAFLSMINELLTNAQDRQYEEELRCIKLSVDRESGRITVYNDGKGKTTAH